MFEILSIKEATDIINYYGQGAPWSNHCIAVKKLAVYFSDIFLAKYNIDKDFVIVTSLLHDIGRYKTQDPILHGIEGYKLLQKLGHEREAFICVSHVLYGLKNIEVVPYGLPNQDFMPITLEQKLIPLFDTLVEHNKPTTLIKRFHSLRKRYSENKEFLDRLTLVEVKALDLLTKLNNEFNINIEDLTEKVLSEKEEIKII